MRKFVSLFMISFIAFCSCRQKEQCWVCTYSMDIRDSVMLVYPDSTWKDQPEQMKCGMTEREQRKFERQNSMSLTSDGKGTIDATFKMDCR